MDVLDGDQWRAGLAGSDIFVSAVLSGMRGIGHRFTSVWRRSYEAMFGDVLFVWRKHEK